MAAADYITATECKSELRITDTVDDTRLATACTVVSRVVDGLCDREDGEFVAAEATRYFDVRLPDYAEAAMDPMALGGFYAYQSPIFGQDHLYLDEFVTLTSLKTDNDQDGVYETVWAATDYLLYPANTLPRDEIAVRPNGRYRFPVGLQTVQVIATFGYADAVPVTVKRACLFLVSRFRARILSPEGLKGSPDGQMVDIARMDPDVQMILETGRLRRSTRAGLHFA